MLLAVAGNKESNVMASHIRNLSKGLGSSSNEFLHDVIEHLVRPSSEAALQEHSSRSRENDELFHSSEQIFVEIARRNLSVEQVAADFVAVGVANDQANSFASTLCSVIEERQDEIDRVLIKNTTLISAGTLEDFDWSLRLVMGSDQLSTLRQPLLLLSLTIRKTNGEIEHKTLELDQERLSSMLETFDNISNVISKLV
jgi:hypothetical protein